MTGIFVSPLVPTLKATAFRRLYFIPSAGGKEKFGEVRWENKKIRVKSSDYLFLDSPSD
jgi:hypothetical protein